MMSIDSIRAAASDLLPDAERFLCDLIAYPSLSGQEMDAMVFLGEAFGALSLDVERVVLTDSIVSDVDYSSPISGLGYDGRHNLRMLRAGSGGGKTLLLNTHVDVVPPSKGMTAPWTPRVEQGRVLGRGACDAKGQIAVIYLTLKILETLNARLAGDLIVHLVVEEENGGNGSLAMVRRGEKADACICMEPSECKVQTSVRGAVWFRLVLKGKAGHSGQPDQTRSALLMARDAIGVLEQYHDRLRQESLDVPLFDGINDPAPLTFGRMESGSWPSTAPSDAVLEGVLGLLPNKSKEEVCAEMRQALTGCGNTHLVDNFDLSFTYKHDASVIDPGEELPQALLKSIRASGMRAEIAAACCSSDAWLYRNQLRIPTVQFGPGSIRVCHGANEHIALSDITRSAEILSRFIIGYCDGVA